MIWVLCWSLKIVRPGRKSTWHTLQHFPGKLLKFVVEVHWHVTYAQFESTCAIRAVVEEQAL